MVQTANGFFRLPQSDIAKTEQAENSMMPEGLIAQLKEPQVHDLLHHLSRPGQVPLPAGPNRTLRSGFGMGREET